MARDRRVQPTDIRVYIIAQDYLDFEVYRTLKLLVIAHEARLSRSHVSESLGRLVRFGYLQRGERRTTGDPHTFRLPFSWGVRESGTPHRPEPSLPDV